MFMGFITSLITAYVLAHFVSIVTVAGITGAWQLAFWVWFGFMMTVTAGSYLWEGKPLRLFVLNAAEQLVAIFLIALVLVMWR